MLCSFFWVIPRRLNFIYRRFETLCSIFIGGVGRKHKRDEIVGVFIVKPNPFPYKYPHILIPIILSAYTAYEDGTECSETSVYKIQTPGNYPKERIQHKCTLLSVHINQPT